MDTLSTVESETRRSESFALARAPDNFSSYRDAPPALLQKRLLDDGDKEEAAVKKSRVLFSTVKTVRGAGQRHEKTSSRPTPFPSKIDFQLQSFERRLTIPVASLRAPLSTVKWFTAPQTASTFIKRTQTNLWQNRERELFRDSPRKEI